MLCLIVLISQIGMDNFFIRSFLLVICIMLATFSRSDAAMLGMACAALNFIFFSLYRSVLLAPIFYLSIFLTLIWVVLNIDFVILTMQQLWYAASSSNVRVNLLINGITAWLDNPLSIFWFWCWSIFRLRWSFNNWESHSTVIDILTISGIFGAILFYFPAAYAIINFIRSNRLIAASAIIGLIIFTFFGFMGRHPILWLTFYISMMNAKDALVIFKNKKLLV